MNRRHLFCRAGIISAALALVGVAMATTADADPAPVGADPMIVGGQPTTTNDAPFVVILAGPQGRFFCGGSIVAPNKVATAAHCTQLRRPFQIDVVAGRTNPDSDAGIVAHVTDIWIHPDYNNVTSQNDVSVLTLDRHLPYKPIAVATPRDKDLYAPGTSSTVFGWGYTTEGGHPSNTLRKVTVPMVSNAGCSEAYPRYFYPGSMVCAGLAEGGKDACSGDSGGPLQGVTANGTRKLIGIVSWGMGCARPGKYGVYTRVIAFSDLIMKQINN